MLDRGPRRNRLAAALAVAAWVCLLPSPAASQEPTVDDRTMAEGLFRSARELMREGRYAEACPKLEQSQRLVRAAGTLLNLAVCHENEGKVASAWVEFQESLALAVRMNRPDREQVARERMEALEPLVPHIRVEVPPDARVEGLRITRGDTHIPDVSWGVRLPVDPGTYTLRASAPGHLPWSQQVDVELRADEVVTVPRLAPAAVPEAPVAAPAAGTQPARADERVPPGSSRDAPPASGPGTHDTLRTAAWVGGGVGVGVLAAGGYFGVRALQKRAESDDYCPDERCTTRGVELNDEARSLALRSNTLLIAGAALVASSASVLLIVPRDRDQPAGRTPRVDVAAAPGHLGATLNMAW